MTAPTCACCGRPTVDGFVCGGCAAKAGEQLRAIAALAPDARLVAAGLVRRGDGGGGSNKPGSRPPLNDSATDALDEVQNKITTIARDIAETRGLQTPRDGHTLADPLMVACKWLTGQLEWLRHASDDQGGPYAVAVLDEIRECAGRMRSLVDGSPAKKYLGPCGAYLLAEVIPEDSILGIGPEHETRICEGDVYVRGDGSTGRCRTCKAEVARSEREAWLDGEVRSSSFRASEIEDAYGVSANLIRQWATPERQLVRVHDRDFLGRARYLLGEILDVAAGQAAKRAERQAERARRAAQVAESERLSA